MLTNKKRVLVFICSVLMMCGMLFLTGCSPEGPRALLKGKKLVEAHRFVPAIEELKVATSLLVTNAVAWNYLGLAYQGAGQATNAQRAYQKALALNHNLAEVHYNLGCLLLDQNLPEAAKSELTAFVLRQEFSLNGWLKLGAAQLRTRELGNAEKSFNTALKLSAQNPDALNSLGVIQFQKGRSAEAAQYFTAALKKSPNYPPALLNLAVVSQERLNTRPAALQKYREYLDLKPRPPDWEAVNAAAMSLEQQLAPPKAAPPPAVAVVVSPLPNPAPKPPEIAPRVVHTNVPKPVPVVTNQAVAAAPAPTNPPLIVTTKTSPPAVPELPVEIVRIPDGPVVRAPQEVVSVPPLVKTTPPATVAPAGSTTVASAAKPEKRGLLDRMNPLNLFRRDARTAPTITPLDGTLASSPEIAGVPTATVVATSETPVATVAAPESLATPTFTRYHYRSPGKPAVGNRAEAEVTFAQGVKAHREHRLAAAVAAYRAATDTDASFFDAQYNLGLAALEAGDLPQSLLSFERALAITPDSVEARYNFALALKEAGHAPDAAEQLEQLLAAKPEETRAHLALANLYAQQLNQPRRARPHYLKVLALNPGHPQGTAIRYWLAGNPQ